MTAPFILSITSVFTPEQQPRSSAHSKAFAQQIQAGGVYLGFRTLSDVRVLRSSEHRLPGFSTVSERIA